MAILLPSEPEVVPDVSTAEPVSPLQGCRLSLFENAFATKPRDVALPKLLAAIRNGRWREKVEKLRALMAVDRGAYLTRKKLAQRFKVSRTTLWRWQLPSHDLGGHALFRLSEVKSYLQSEVFKRRAAALRAEREQRMPRKPTEPR